MIRFLRSFVLIISILVPSILVPSLVSASTILQFNQITFDNPWIVTPASITASNVSVNVTFNPLFCSIPGCSGLTNGLYFLDFTATPTTVSSVNAGIFVQHYTGSISFTSPTLVNLFTVNFTDELIGSVGGSNPTMDASEPPDSFTGTSDVFDPAKLNIPRGMALSFSDWSPSLALDGLSVRAARADATGTFNATTVPEPSTALLVFPFIGSILVYRMRQNRKRNRCQ